MARPSLALSACWSRKNLSKATFRVLWSENAALDLEDCVRYLARESPARARQLLKRVHETAKSLGAMPERGRIVPELAEFGITIWRELVVRPYRLIYRTERRTVLVDGFFDSRRDLEELLIVRMLSQ